MWSVIIAVVLAVCIFAALRVAHVSKLSALVGERTFYLDSASSQGLQKKTLSGLDFLRVRGESVCMDTNQPSALALATIQAYDAEIVWVEEVCGITSYYCYTNQWNESTWIAGKRINLHVAITDNRCVVGYPIIFGGF